MKKQHKSMGKCPICREYSSLEFVEEGEKHMLYKCSNCDVVFSDPFQNLGQEWYEKAYRLSTQINMKFYRTWHFRQFLKEPLLRTNKLEILDIGCGTGFFLNEVSKLGHHTFGIDFNRESIKFAKERYDLKNLYPVDLKQFIEQFPSRKFEIITCFEVLEHLDNPNEFINLVRCILKPRGYIAITLPNRNRFLTIFKGGDSPPHHLTRWSMDALESFLTRHGFEVITKRVQRIDVEVVSHFLESLFSFGIAAKYAQKGVENKDLKSVKIATTLGNIKSRVFKFISYPISIFTKHLPLQGTELYCFVRLKQK